MSMDFDFLKSGTFLVALFLLVGFASADTNWLEKEPWSDRPSYAEDISVSISPTDLIEDRKSTEVCESYSNSTAENGSTVQTCDSYSTSFYGGSSVGMFDYQAQDSAYLGNGVVRVNATVSLNFLSEETFYYIVSPFHDESDYIDWFNQRYMYKGENLTSSRIDDFQSKVENFSPKGENTKILAQEVNSISLSDGSADMTYVFRFDDFQSGVLTISDLLRVEVESSIG